MTVQDFDSPGQAANGYANSQQRRAELRRRLNSSVRANGLLG